MKRRIATLATIAVMIGSTGFAASVSAAPRLEPGGTFTDDDESIHEGAIEAIRAAGITVGCNPPASNEYCPDQLVSRQQMASFLVRALDLPAATSDYFDDDATSVHQSDINSIASAGITLGCNPPSNDLFCPSQPVTRAQIASFFVRGFGLPPSTIDVFSDDSTSVHEADINSLAAAGWTKGCNSAGTAYCPNAPLTRAEMGSFLQRALGLPFLEVPDPLPTESPSPLVTIGSDKWLYYTPTIDETCVDAALYAEAAIALDHIRQTVENSGREFHFAIAPNKASIHPDQIPAEFDGTSCHPTNSLSLRAALTAHPSANPIAIWDALTAAAQTRLVYFKHDTHWNGEGALIAAESIAGDITGSPWDSAMLVPDTASRTGDLAGFIGIDWIEDFPDSSTSVPGTTTSITESGFYNKRTIVTYETTGPIDTRKAVVFHDSFGYLLQNKLGPLFSQVTFIPAYSYPGEDVTAFVADAEIIIVELVERRTSSLLNNGKISGYFDDLFGP